MADQVQDRTEYKCAEGKKNLQAAFIQIHSVLSESPNVPLTTFWVNMGDFITCSCDVLPCMGVQMLLVPTVTSGKPQPDRESIASKRRCVIRQNHPVASTVVPVCLPRAGGGNSSFLSWSVHTQLNSASSSLSLIPLPWVTTLSAQERKKPKTDFNNVMIIIVLLTKHTKDAGNQNVGWIEPEFRRKIAHLQIAWELWGPPWLYCRFSAG